MSLDIFIKVLPMFFLSKAFGKISRTIRSISYIFAIHKNKNTKIQIEKNRKSFSDITYISNPKISIILQFFNKRHNIKEILHNLRLSGAEEIIVIDDGSIDGSYDDWPLYLNHPNDFLIRSNDLFEVRTYDRAIRMARGEFVCLLQDDDIPQPNNTWIKQAIHLFETFPKLIMLGGRDGMDIMLPDSTDTDTSNDYYKRIGNIVEWKGVHKLRTYNPPAHTEPVASIPFMFTMTVNRAPTFLRRTEFLNIGGINQAYAPFQLDDDDACVRAWLAGYQVGFYISSFKRDFDVGGMSLFNSKQRKEQVIKNARRFYMDHGTYISNGYLQDLVNKANNDLIQKRYEY